MSLTSRGVRAIAQFPQHVYGLDTKGVHVNLYEPGGLQFVSPEGESVELNLETRYPFDGNVNITVRTGAPTRFSLRMRIPGWCTNWQLQVNGTQQNLAVEDLGYIALERAWQDGDSVSLVMKMPVRVVIDRLGNPGKAAFVRGPLVYAADNSYLDDESLLDDLVVRLSAGQSHDDIRILTDDQTGYPYLLVPAVTIRATPGDHLWREGLRYSEFLASESEQAAPVRLIPFFDAGNRDRHRYRDGIWPHWHDPARRVTYQVWLPYST